MPLSWDWGKMKQCLILPVLSSCMTKDCFKTSPLPQLLLPSCANVRQRKGSRTVVFVYEVEVRPEIQICRSKDKTLWDKAPPQCKRTKEDINDLYWIWTPVSRALAASALAAGYCSTSSNAWCTHLRDCSGCGCQIHGHTGSSPWREVLLQGAEGPCVTWPDLEQHAVDTHTHTQWHSDTVTQWTSDRCLSSVTATPPPRKYLPYYSHFTSNF